MQVIELLNDRHCGVASFGLIPNRQTGGWTVLDDLIVPTPLIWYGSLITLKAEIIDVGSKVFREGQKAVAED